MSKLRKKLAERNRINLVRGFGAVPRMSLRKAGLTPDGRQMYRPIVPDAPRMTRVDNGRQFSN